MFHRSASALRRTLAQAFAALLILAAVGHLSTAHAQVPIDLDTVYSTAFSSATITGTSVVGRNPPVIGDQARFKWQNPYDQADFTVRVDVIAGVKIDGLQVRGPALVEMRNAPSYSHVVSGVTRRGLQEIFVGPQFVTPGVSTFRVTITLSPRVPNAPPALANMCNPIPHVGVFGGLSIGPQVITRSNISIGPGEMECYQFTVAPLFAGGRRTTLTISNLPPTGTKTITIVNPNGPYPLGPLSTTANSLNQTVTIQPGNYYLVIVVGGNSVSRTNYNWAMR